MVSTLWTRPLPQLVWPTTRPRSWSCTAPVTISLALAEPRLMRMTRGKGSSWAPLLALSGFRYDGIEKAVSARPLVQHDNFSSFWSAGTAWGSFSQHTQGGETRFNLSVTEGKLAFGKVTIRPQKAAGAEPTGKIRNKPLPYKIQQDGDEVTFLFTPEVTLNAGDQLVLTL